MTKVNSCIKFARNLININAVINIYLYKKDHTIVTAIV